jgi:hypothetical protein
MARRRPSGGEQATLVLLYHPKTGTIVHAHYAAADPGADLPARAAIERDAVHYARQRGARRGGVAVDALPRLHVDPRRFRPDRAYRVDVKSRTLVPAGRMR